MSSTDVIADWSAAFSGDVPDGLGLEKPDPVIEISGPYRTTTITFGFSGTAAYHTKVFSAAISFTLSVPANRYSVSVSSDDTATVSVGDVSASSTLQKSASAETETWIQSPPESLAAEVSFSTIGGPYSLSVIIVLTESLREICFSAEVNSPDDRVAAAVITDETEKENYLYTLRTLRTSFGCGESVSFIYRNKENGNSVDAPVTADGDVFEDDGSWKANTIATEKNDCCEANFTFSDGEQITKTFSVVVPEYETAQIVSEEDFPGEPADTTGCELFVVKYFVVTIHPTSVPFSHLFFWEVGDIRNEKTGVFEVVAGTEDSIHMPMEPDSTNEYNEWADKAYLCFRGASVTVMRNYAASSVNGLAQKECLGEMTWLCPVRWSITNPGTDTRTASECEEEGLAKNGGLPYDGVIGVRTQISSVFGSYDEDICEVEIEIDVLKTFPEEEAEE